MCGLDTSCSTSALADMDVDLDRVVHTDGPVSHKSTQVRPNVLHFAVQHAPKVSLVECGTQTDVTWHDTSDNEEYNTSTSDGCESSSTYSLSDTSEEDDLLTETAYRTAGTSGKMSCLAYEESIRLLLKFCPVCGAAVIEETLCIWYDGTMLLAKGSCLHDCAFSWTSQPTVSSHRNRCGKGNFELAASIMVCGGTFTLIKEIANCMGLGMFSHTTYDTIQRDFVAPVVFSSWHRQQTVLLQELSICASVRLAGDGRSDSPGFSAKYTTYTLMDSDTGFVVMGRTMQLGQESESSVGMEAVALESTLDQLLAHEIPVSVLTTDRSPSVISLMRRKYNSVTHQHDIWHIAKSVKKHLLAKARKKDSECLKDWVKSAVNHMYYCAQNCNEDPNILVELWRSLACHVAGVHHWPLDGVAFRHINSCQHDNSIDVKLAAEGRAVNYLKEHSDAHLALKQVSVALHAHMYMYIAIRRIAKQWNYNLIFYL